MDNKWYSISNRLYGTASIAHEKIDRSLEVVGVANALVDEAKAYTNITEITTTGGKLIIKFSNGITFDCGRVQGYFPQLRYKQSVGVEMKYDNEPDSMYKVIVPISDINLTFDKLTPQEKDQLKFKYKDFTPEEIQVLQKPATDAAAQANIVIDLVNKALAKIEQDNATINSNEDTRKVAENTRISDENVRKSSETARVRNESDRQNAESIRTSSEATRQSNEQARKSNELARQRAEDGRVSAETSRQNTFTKTINDTNAAKNLALEVGNHPTYVGVDFFVYKWDTTTKAYSKTDICLRPEAFSIFKSYQSVSAMNNDAANIPPGKFVVINGSVEAEDTGKLYMRTTAGFDYLVDMSGMRGFTGKTPQFSIGTVTTSEYNTPASVTLTSTGNDSSGNPTYAINLSVPKGKPGSSMVVHATYPTVEALRKAIPNGSNINGCCAVGSAAPYDYYFWSSNNAGGYDWMNHGRLEGPKGEPYTWKDLTSVQKNEMAANTGNYIAGKISINPNGHLVFETGA